MIWQDLSSVEWKPSAHMILDKLLRIVSQDKPIAEEGEMEDIPEENKGNSLYHSSISNITR